MKEIILPSQCNISASFKEKFLAFMQQERIQSAINENFS
jgi:hypothetical protein